MVLLGVGTLVVGVVVGLAVLGRDGTRDTTGGASPPAGGGVVLWPAGVATPAGGASAAGRWPRSELGARQAAVSFLELTEEVVSMPPPDAARLQRSISSGGSADRLAVEVEDKLSAIQAEVPDGVVVHVAPISTRATVRGEGWEVAIWYAQVVVYGHEIAFEQWNTATYVLVWEGGGWRMDALDSTAGPNPSRPAAVVATPVLELLSVLAGFDDEGMFP